MDEFSFSLCLRLRAPLPLKSRLFGFDSLGLCTNVSWEDRLLGLLGSEAGRGGKTLLSANTSSLEYGGVRPSLIFPSWYSSDSDTE